MKYWKEVRMLQALIGPVTSLVGKFIEDKERYQRYGQNAGGYKIFP